jgi:hypothetical protein
VPRHERIGVLLACLSAGFVLFNASPVFLVLLGLGVAEIFARGVLAGYREPLGRARALRPSGDEGPVVPDAPPPHGLRQRKVFWFSGLVMAVFARGFLTHLTLHELALLMTSVAVAATVVASVVDPVVRRKLRERDQAPALPPGHVTR